MPAVGVGVGPSHRIASQRGGGGAAFDADATALIAAMTTEPDAARQTLINDTVVALKAAGVWAKLDFLHVYAAHSATAGLINWKNPGTFDLTLVNGMPHEVDRGIGPGDGTTQYGNTNFAPSTDGVNYTQNDASLGVYSRTNIGATMADIGARNGTDSNVAFVYARMSTGNQLLRINQNTGATNIAVANSLGLHANRRTTVNEIQAIKNGQSIGTDTKASTGVPSVSFFVGADNQNSSPTNFSTRQYALAFAGAAMSEAEQADFYATVQNYMTAVGAGV